MGVKKRFNIKNKKIKDLIKSFGLILVLSFVIGGLYTFYEKRTYENKIAKFNSINIEIEKKNFIKDIELQSIKTYKEYGVLPSITIAQAIIESGWGQSKLTKTSNNLFGIKADKAWKGKKVAMITSENYSDEIVANFRKYDSLNDSIKDHGRFLKENPRYTRNGLFKEKDYKGQAQALENAGYSTKKNEKGEAIYADILIELIEKYKLNLLD